MSADEGVQLKPSETQKRDWTCGWRDAAEGMRWD